MKKLLLVLSAIALLAGTTKAQDFGFETWGDAAPPFATIDDPQGWASLNALTLVGTDTSVFKETVAPAAGTASVRIKTVKVNGATLPSPYGGSIDTAGMLIIGKIVAFPAPGLKYGAASFAAAQRPAMLSFQSKYSPMPGDSAFILAYMTHWNGVKRDTIGSGKYATGVASSTYGLHSLNMTYKPAFAAVVADSQQIFISSSVYSHNGAKLGSTFYVDDLVWSGYVSTDDIDGIESNVSVYPNPANDLISIECSVDAQLVEVMDVTGRKVGSYKMQNNKVSIQTNGFSKGTYIYQVMTKDNTVLNHGKFEVMH